MAAGHPKIALVYHEMGDGKRLPFLNNLVHLFSLVEPGVTCEILPAIRLIFEKRIHDVSTVVTFLFGKDTEFPDFPADIRQYFKIPSENDLLIVTQIQTAGNSRFPAENIVYAKDLVKNANDWCPSFFSKLFPKKPTGTATNKDVIFVCDASSKAVVFWCQMFVNKIKDLGGQAVCPGTPEWTSADAIMGSIKPTSLVVLVATNDGMSLMVKYGPLIGSAREKAKVVIATEAAEKISLDLQGKDITMFSKDQPIDLWLGIMSHLELVSCKLAVDNNQEASTSFIMPFARPKPNFESGGIPTWVWVILCIFAIILLPVFIVLVIVYMLLGAPGSDKQRQTHPA